MNDAAAAASDAGASLARDFGRAVRWHAALRALECAAAGALGGAVVFAAGIASDAAVSRELFVVALGASALTAGLAWRERPPRAADVARRADERAGLDGALPAALDATRASARTPLALALVARVRATLGPRVLARAALPRSPLALVAPLLAAGIVAVALERRHSAPARGASASPGLRAAAEQSRASDDAATADALEIAARRLDALAVARGDAPADASERARVAADLERLARALDRDDPSRAAVDRAVRELDARGSGASDDPRGADEGARAAVAGAGPDGSGIPSASAPGSASGGTATSSGAAGLANAPADGRMFGPPAGGESDPADARPSHGTLAAGGPGRAVRSARWWPRRYDAVVERYLAP